MSTIEEVKLRTDIVEVIGQFTKLSKAGRNFRGLCPFHSEKTPSFFVNPEQQSWHCFGACSTGGDVLSFVMKKQGVPFGDALRYLAERAGVTLPSLAEKEGEKDGKERLYQVNQAAASYFHQLLLTSTAAEKARVYLVQRGLIAQTITEFQLGYSLNEWEALKQNLLVQGYKDSEMVQAGLVVMADDGNIHDRFRHKLMFPIYDTRGRVTGFGARVLDDSLPKYTNSPQTPLFDKSGSLYGVSFAASAIRKADLAVIVEGYMDVIIAHQYGVKNAIASMGTSITERQMNTLKRFSRNVALALDADTAGEEAMLRGVQYENLLGTEVKIIVLPQGKDPDEVIKDDIKIWQTLVAAATPVIDYNIQNVTNGLNLTSIRDKTAAVDRLLPIIGGIQDDVRRDHYLNKLAEMTNTTYRSMEAALSKLKVPKKVKENRSETTSAISRSILASPVEEYVLALLLQYPEIRKEAATLPSEYFENSENREIYLAWQQTPEITQIKGQLDSAVLEHLELILEKKINDTQLERKYADCTLRLQEKYLRHLEHQKSQLLALERETGGTDAELARQSEQGLEVRDKLLEVFTRRAQQGQKR